jgi:hypothetical protein
VHLVDLDGGRLRRQGPWRRRNLRRLHRSLRKVTHGLGGGFRDADWSLLLEAYTDAVARAEPSP